MGYLNLVVLESLRVMSPVPHATVNTLSRDAQIGKYQVRAGDVLQINISGLHKNPAEWQRPKEFIPERFDSSSPLSLTPAGTKRKTMSFCPFYGGKRVCFGKTFAEANLKIMATYLSQYFEMEFVEKDKYPDTHNLPMAQIGQSENPPIPVKLSARPF